MPRHHRRGQPQPDAVEQWREWQDHQYDFGYYGRLGRVSPVLHARTGFTLVVLGACFSLLGVLSAFSGTLALGLLIPGGALLVAGIAMLRWNARRRRVRQAQGPRHRRRRRKAHR
jgi:hypothetical protein